MFVGLWIRQRYVSKNSKKFIAFFRLPISLCFFITIIMIIIIIIIIIIIVVVIIIIIIIIIYLFHFF